MGGDVFPPPWAVVPAGHVEAALCLGNDSFRLDVPGKRAYRLGRLAEQCDVHIQQTAASRLHAVVGHSEAGGLCLEDQHSANGTFVDGERVRGGAIVPLHNGMRIRFGDGDEYRLVINDGSKRVDATQDLLSSLEAYEAPEEEGVPAQKPANDGDPVRSSGGAGHNRRRSRSRSRDGDRERDRERDRKGERERDRERACGLAGRADTNRARERYDERSGHRGGESGRRGDGGRDRHDRDRDRDRSRDWDRHQHRIHAGKHDNRERWVRADDEKRSEHDRPREGDRGGSVAAVASATAAAVAAAAAATAPKLCTGGAGGGGMEGAAAKRKMLWGTKPKEASSKNTAVWSSLSSSIGDAGTQDKFLKLMGGKKPGNEAGAAAPVDTKHVSEMQYKLQREFEDATRRMGGKTGLG